VRKNKEKNACFRAIVCRRAKTYCRF